MTITDKIEWISNNDKNILTGFDMIFMGRMIVRKSLDDEDFRKYFEIELINLKEASLTDSQSRVGLLERIRSNIVRELYSSRDLTQLEASMMAYIFHIKEFLNDKRQEIIKAVIEEIEEHKNIPKIYRDYLIDELFRRESILKIHSLINEIEMSEAISDLSISIIKKYLVGTCSYESMYPTS